LVLSLDKTSFDLVAITTSLTNYYYHALVNLWGWASYRKLL